MSSGLSASFLVSEQQCDWFECNACSYMCEFDVRHYDDSIFTVLEIDFPSSLCSSVAKRRAEFLAGRYCARLSLQQLGVYQKSIPIGKHRGPIWPDNVIGTISHSSTRAVCIVTDENAIMGLGVDIEDVVDFDTANSTQSQFASQSELELLRASSGVYLDLLTVLFSAKESFFKAAYPSVKRYFEFDAVSLSRIDLKNREFDFVINQNLGPSLLPGKIVSGKFEKITSTEIATLVVLKCQ